MVIFGPFKTFLILVLLFFSCSQLLADTQNYFSNPNLFSSDKLSEELKEKTLDMCWHFGVDSHFRFVSGNNEIYFEVFLGTLPDIYNDLINQAKDRFIEAECRDKKQRAFSYKIKNNGLEEINVLQTRQNQEHPDANSYIVANRRVIENSHPKHLFEHDLAEIIRDKNILFYTGAGLSLDSDVPAMDELNRLLGLEEGERFLFSLEKAWCHPRDMASKISVFHKACLFSSPTSAHLALKDLAIFKNIRMITENLDCLHERSGIYPYRVNAKQLREEIGGEFLSQTEYIICVGLSFDDHGFLGWYKKQNPLGKIIAVDLKQPSYLGDEDYMVVGNLQEIFPSIQKKVLKATAP